MITRKHPPQIGGMEQLSSCLTKGLSNYTPVQILVYNKPSVGLPIFFIYASIKIIVAISKKRISVLHLGDPVLACIGWLAKCCGIPVVVTVHGLDWIYDRLFYQVYLKLFARQFDAYIAISERVRTLLLESGITSGRVHCILPAIQPNQFLSRLRSTPAKHDASTLTILSLGRLVKRKGIAWFIETICPELMVRFPKLRYIVAGDGPERERIISTIKQHNLQESILLLGALDEADKSQWYNYCDIFIMPNIPVAQDVEGFGLTALEAGWYGKAVVVADIEGLRDAVQHEKNGWHVPAGDRQAWLSALTTLLESPQLRARLGLNAQTYLQKHNNVDAMCKAYLEIFNALAA